MSYEEEPPAPTRLPPPVTEEEIQQFVESQTPGAAHGKLEPLVGRFEAHVLHWSSPDQPPSESTGVLENSWALGKRFILSQYHGEEMGQPFEGLGLMGYDTSKQKYVGNWADSMSTALWPTGSGDVNDDGDAFTLSRVMTDPLSGLLVKIRDVTTIVDANHLTYEMFATYPGADEFKLLEAHYTRT
jgi:hypothetical protein